jgi:N-carbamoylputrescine amidase
LLDDAPHDRDACIIRHCDFALIEETRRNWPFLRDRRIDAYGGITNRFGTP